MFRIRLRNPLARIIYNPTEEPLKPDAIFFFAGTVCWRRDSRSHFKHWRGRQICLADPARLQPHFLGDYSDQVELAAPGPAPERTLPARLSQVTALAGYCHVPG